MGPASQQAYLQTATLGSSFELGPVRVAKQPTKLGQQRRRRKARRKSGENIVYIIGLSREFR